MFKFLFIEKNHSIFVQTIRYMLAGMVCFLIDVSLYYVMTVYYGVYYLVSAAIAFLIGVMLNYIANIKWVFSKRSIQNTHQEFGIFMAIELVGLIILEVLIFAFTEYMNVLFLFSKIIANCFVFFWNYFAKRYILFHKNFWEV